MTNQLANFLADRGVSAGDRIGVNGTQRVEPLVTYIAAFKLGAISVPPERPARIRRARYRLDDCSAKAFVVDHSAVDVLRAVRDDLDELTTVLTMGDSAERSEHRFREAIDDYPHQFDTVTTRAEDVACIIYTLGTTG